MKASSVVLLVAVLLPLALAFSANHERIIRMMSAPTSSNNALWYTQKLDHFNAQDAATYQQRYWVNDTFWSATGPVLIYIGGEAALSDNAVLNGEFVELGQRYGALLLALEHRYYGLSMPFTELTTANLQFLSSEQALEDLAQFLRWYLEQRGAVGREVLCVGGSYPGSLSAWFRTKYPNLVVGSLASSAPVLAWADYYMYDQIVAASAGPVCAQAVRSTTLQVVSLLQDPTSAAQVKARFGCSTVAGDVNFLYVIADCAAFAIQYGLKDKLCSVMTNTSMDGLTAYSQFVQWVFTHTGTTAETWDIASFTGTTAGEQDNMRQWMYQSCTEFGYFQTAPAHDSLRAVNITLQWHYDVCQTLFGVPLLPNTEAVNRRYGGNDTAATNVFFVNGSEDPWHVLSVQRELSASLPAVVISGTAHCTDLHASQPTDSAALRVARADISNYIGRWLSILPTCPNDCSGHGTCLSTNACACNSGYMGADCSVAVSNYAATGILAGGIAGGVVVGALITLVTVLVMRRRCPQSLSGYETMQGS